MALDPETGEPKPASLEKDPDGNFVLRMYDAAPHAFDPALEAKRVIVLGDRNIVPGNITNTDALADVPEFDQETQAVFEKEPMDMGDYIYIDVEVREVEPDDEEMF